MHVLTCSRCSGSSGGLTHDGDDLGSSLGHFGDELFDKEGVVTHNFSETFTPDGRVECVRVLCGGVITPNDDVLNIFHLSSSFFSNLASGTKLV